MECNECGKIYKNNVHLRVHKLIHNDVGKYKCDVCNLIFKQPAGLNYHHRIYHPLIDTRKYKYKCDICNSKFKHLKSFENHKTTHKVPIKDLIGIEEIIEL